MFEIVTLSKFPDIFQQFLRSANTYEPDTQKLAVLDSEMYDTYAKLTPLSWTGIRGINPFIFARNANMGIRAAGNNDVVLVNDDVSFCRKDSLKDLERAAYASSKIGLISPVISGVVGNMYQRVKCPGRSNGISISPKRLAFVCVYIKRSTIDEIGLLDEQFDGYGGDDDDYCYRAEQAGFKLAVTTNVQVRHGFGYCPSSTSFSRTMGDTSVSMMEMKKKFIAKHKVLPRY
jgi:hypothetical protein